MEVGGNLVLLMKFHPQENFFKNKNENVAILKIFNHQS
jgi:hypothetical protein